MNHGEILEKFFSENPDMSDTDNPYRQIADWQFDTRFRSQVEAGVMDLESAFHAARDAAYKILPKPAQPTDPHEALRELAMSRNQEPPYVRNATDISTFVSRPADESDSVAEANQAIRELAESRNQAPPHGRRTKPHANFR